MSDQQQLTPEQLQANLAQMLAQVQAATGAQPQAQAAPEMAAVLGQMPPPAAQPQFDLQQLAQLIAAQQSGRGTVVRDRGPRATATLVAVTEENREGGEVNLYKLYPEEVVDKYGGEAGLIDALEDAGVQVKAWFPSYGGKRRTRGRGRR